MTEPKPATRQIEVSDEAYEVLARTAESRGTDINGALLYLMQAPAVPTASAETDDDTDDTDDD